MAIPLNDNIETRAPKPIDGRTMKIVGGVATAFSSVLDANTLINPVYRHRFLTVPIIIGGQAVDHWYETGTDDGDLVPKMIVGINVPSGFTASSSINAKGTITISSNLNGFIKGNGSGFTSQLSIVNGDITSLSFSKLTSIPNTLAGHGITDAQPFITAGTTSQYYRGDKVMATLDKSAVGLSNVDNTSDVNKPVSISTQSALNAKQATLVSGTTIKTIEDISLLGSGNIPFPVIWLGAEFVGSGLDSSNRVRIDASQLSIGTIPLSRFGVSTVPISASAATGGSSGRVLSYDGTWVSNGTSNIQMTSDGAGFTIAPPIASGHSASVLTLGTNPTFPFINEIKSLQRLDIVAPSNDIWLTADNINVSANVLAVQFNSANATSTGTQVSSFSLTMRNSLWDGSANNLKFSGIRSVASTTVNGLTRLSFFGNSSNSLLTAGTLLMSILSTGVSTYADNTAALGAGLVTGDLYKTSDGTVKIVL
jgi:hypothetical protein